MSVLEKSDATRDALGGMANIPSAAPDRKAMTPPDFVVSLVGARQTAIKHARGPSSIRPQRLHRIQPRCPPGGDEACQRRDHDQNGRRAHEHARLLW